MASGSRTPARALLAHTRGVRFRATAAAVVVVGGTLTFAAVGMVELLRRSLTENVRNGADASAEQVADLLEEGGLGRVGSGDDGDDDDEFVQVLDPQGGVAATSNDELDSPVADVGPGEDQSVRVSFDDDLYLVVATTAELSGGDYQVLVGRSLDNVDESSGTLTGLLSAGIPLLVIVVAGVTWYVVGRSLAPVEAIRSEVESISTGELHRRVPMPQSRDEIARLATTMNQMLERIDKGYARQKRFVSDASHELRSPVASIRQYAELAKAHPDEVSVDDLAGTVLQEDLRLQRLVDDLLLLARMDEHGLGAQRRTLDLDDIVFEEIDRISKFTDKEIDAGKVSGGRVSGDRRLLSRLVANVLENAVRHAAGRVALALGTDDSTVLFSVDDDGIGVPVPDRARIFERFVRLDEARGRESGGSGIGLAIVAEVAAAHGGSARLIDSPLGGARVEVRLPQSTQG